MLHLEQIFFPDSLKEAVAILHSHGNSAFPVAGGTGLANHESSQIRFLVDLSKLGLNKVSLEGNQVVIGSTVTMADLSQDLRVLTTGSGLLSMACRKGWPKTIVQTATIGGNIARGNPYADAPTALLALDAVLVFVDSEGTHEVPFCDFFQGYRRTVADTGIIKEVRFTLRPELQGIFLKVAEEGEGKPLINVALAFELTQGHIQNLRIAVGGVTSTPCRLVRVEDALEDAAADESLPEKAAILTQEWVEPSIDVRISLDDQRRISGHLIRKAFEFVLKRAG